MGIFKRKKPNGKVRKFDAARFNRLFADWITSSISAHEEVKGDWLTTVKRSRDKANNDPYIRKFLSMTQKGVVGEGFLLNMNVRDANGNPDNLANDTIERDFKAWGDNPLHADMAGKLCWVDHQNRFIRSVARDGEALCRIIRGADNPYGFSLKWYDPRVLDVNHNEPKLPNGNQIIMGVEVNKWGRPVRYWLSEDGNNSIKNDYSGRKKEAVPARDIIHEGMGELEDQVRYMPWTTPILSRLHMLDKYEEAEMVAAREAACRGMFYEQDFGDAYDYDELDSAGRLLDDLAPGFKEILPPGVKAKQHDPNHPVSAYADFVKGVLRGISSGLDVAYNGLANDLEGVNFSSMRSGALEERETWKVLQGWMSRHFLSRVFSEWLLMYLTSGVSSLPLSKYDKFNKPTWQGRRWQWVDPLKDAKMNETLHMLGVKSKQTISEELGFDVDKEQDRLKAEKPEVNND